MVQELFSVEDVCLSLLDATIRVDEATSRLFRLSDFSLSRDAVKDFLVVEVDYLNRVVIAPLKGKVFGYVDSLEVMRFWNQLQQHLLKFRRVYENVARSV